ncbi:MAG: hypothetical protein MJA27_35780 [Pseudanabaenales cyanobacterium]|nr:hypothetical protein [Pseudanabaenales cyanobacterium]
MVVVENWETISFWKMMKGYCAAKNRPETVKLAQQFRNVAQLFNDLWLEIGKAAQLFSKAAQLFSYH